MASLSSTSSPVEEALPQLPVLSTKSIDHRELKCISAHKLVRISTPHPDQQDDETRAAFYDIKGYGPPFSTPGSPGDIYFDLTPQPFVVYVRTENEWAPWNWTDRDPRKRNFAMATHPIWASRYLNCKNLAKGLNWYSPESLRGHALPGQEFNPQNMLAAILRQYKVVRKGSPENTIRMHMEHQRRQSLISAPLANELKRPRSPILDLTCSPSPERKLARTRNDNIIDLSGVTVSDDESTPAKNSNRKTTSARTGREGAHEREEQSIRSLKQTISDQQTSINALQANLTAAEQSRNAALRLYESMEILYSEKKQELEQLKNQYGLKTVYAAVNST